MKRLVMLLAFLAPSLFAQTSPFLPDDLYTKLVNEISGEIAHEHMRWFTHYHRPMGGSEGFEAVAKYVEQKARDYGLEDVRYIKLQSDTQSWTARHGELWLTSPETRRLAFTPEIAIALADYSRSADIPEAELIDVGEGTKESDYAGKHVAGKVVLASGGLSTVMEEAVWKRGALGILAFTKGRVPDFPDQIPWMRIPVENKEKTKKGTFAFVLSNREGMKLREQMAAATPPPPPSAPKGKKASPSAAAATSTVPFKVRVKIDSYFLETPQQAIVEATIRGSEIHDQDIVLTAHLQEELFSANDDASGCASILEIARALKRMIGDGRLSRPRRDIRFWWADEISAEEQYFADRPDERAQFLANINQDMVGAKQSLGGRIQFVTRPPWSRAHFLGDVVESIVESIQLGNTSFLAAGQARQIARGVATPGAISPEDLPFSRPILSKIGTRERYDARVIPFHNNTDHQVFNIGIIGIPAVTFTNWPDDYIHSTDDDLWQMDRTQLKRNAVTVAAIAWYMANVGERDMPTLTTQMHTRGLERLSRDSRRASEIIGSARESDRAAAWKRARNLAIEGARRERRAVESLRKVAPESSFAALAGQMASDTAIERLVATSYTAFAKTPPPTEMALTEREESMAKKIPRYVDSVKQYLDGRKNIEKPKTLHGLMAYEALNFVDGRRSVLDIYRAVAAEADAAGEWYYGRVTPEDISAYLDSAEKSGMIKFVQP